jgi:UDPglucose 6-dehydrogenase
LAFKPGTDDMRNAPSLDIIRILQKEGAKIKAFDPQAMRKAGEYLDGVKFCRDAYEAARGSDCLVVITEWDEFKELDFKRIKKLIKQPVIFDGRNIYSPAAMEKLGFQYFGIGRR